LDWKKKWRRYELFVAFNAILPDKTHHMMFTTKPDSNCPVKVENPWQSLDVDISFVCLGQQRIPIEGGDDIFVS
jgi:hypothetical protein